MSDGEDGPDLSCFNFGDDSDDGGDKTDESQEVILKRHRQEEQQLRTEAKAKKHAIHKADKAARAEADAALEAALEEMRQRHARELGGDDGAASALSELSVGESKGKGKAGKQAQAQQGSKSKADKRRAKKEEEDRERERRIADHHSGSGPSERDVEIEAIAKQLTPQGLRILDIAADGHCLYRAVAQQLGEGSEAFAGCRQTAAQYIRSHANDFLPYIAAEGMELGPYCETVEKSNEWGGVRELRRPSAPAPCSYTPPLRPRARLGRGNTPRAVHRHSRLAIAPAAGQLEITALANAHKRCFVVYSADAPVLVTCPEYAEQAPKVQLAYHKHYYGLGAHYNSIMPL